jgi:kinesin family protein C2/C3
VATPNDVVQLLNTGIKNRRTAETQMNTVSSRSHLILSVYLKGHNTVTGTTMRGKLHLVDLAGSERVGRSNVSGAALKEAQNINKSLSSLGNVIAARANKAGHVPCR